MVTRPLEGIRVVELGYAISAPHCARILADHGADVIRVEPAGGDRTRGAVHITGFGTWGPARGRGAYDGVIQAMSGVPWLTGEPGGPLVFVGAFVADHLAATQAAVGALLALARRNATGTGGCVEISMLDGYLSALAHHVGSVLDLGVVPQANGNQVPTAFANTFQAADGFVYLVPLSPQAWQAFCTVIDAPQWLRDAESRWRIEAGKSAAEQVVQQWTRRRPRREIVEQLRAAGVPCSRVNDVAEAVSDPVHEGRSPIVGVLTPSGREFWVPGPEVRLDTAAEVRPDTAPAAGEHTAEVLQALGYDMADLEPIAANGVISQVPAGGHDDAGDASTVGRPAGASRGKCHEAEGA